MKDAVLTDQDYIIIKSALDFVLEKYNVGIMREVTEGTLGRVEFVGKLGKWHPDYNPPASYDNEEVPF